MADAPAMTPSNTGAGALPPPAPLSKAQRKQQERLAQSLAFLARIERVRVTGTTFRDEHEQLQLQVVMRDAGATAQLSARAARKDARVAQPSVTYVNMKSLSTLRGVHVAVHQWSAKHPGPTALDGTSRCAYCSQFNSPAALQLWKWNEIPQPRQQETQAALTVVVNNSTSNANNAANSMLTKYEACLNSYLEAARAVDVDDGSSESASKCEGRAHIPTLVASYLQNEEFSSVAVNVALFSCLVM